MRWFLIIGFVAASSLALCVPASAQGGGRQCGGGMQAAGGMPASSLAGTPGMSSAGSLGQMLGPTQAYLQAAAAMSAYQAQQREQRVSQNRQVYQQRRAELVAARQAALRSNRSQFAP
jgi:hypothetical protein